MNKKSLSLLVLASCLVSLITRANDIEPDRETYIAAQKTITAIDGNLSDWAGVPFWKDTKFYIPKSSGSGPPPNGNIVAFEQYSGGTWSGPADQSSAFGVVWDANNVYIGVVVVDDSHENNANSAWNGDSLQVMFANAARDTETFGPNYGLGGVDGALGTIADDSMGTTEVAIVRDTLNKMTFYEIRIPATNLNVTLLTNGMQIGLGLCVNDGDDDLGPPDQTGQKGWSGWGAHSIVFGRTPRETGLLKLQSTPFIAVTSLSPSYMAQNVPLSTNIEAVLTEVGLGVLDGSEVLKLNGQTVNATITPTGTAPSRVISVKFAATLTAGTAYTAELDYKDVNGQSYSQTWPFNVPARHYVNALRFDAWLNIPGATTNDIDLTVLGNPPGSGPAGGGTVPDFQAIPITTFDSRDTFSDNTHETYQATIAGRFVPDQTGTYYFHIRSDDASELFLNTNGPALPNPSTDTPVAIQTGCCNNFVSAPSVLVGGPFTLQAGTKYGILGLYKEGGGGDYMQVAITRDGDAANLITPLDPLRSPSAISGKYLESDLGADLQDLMIIDHPHSVSVVETFPATFSVRLSAVPYADFKWQSAPPAGTFTDIAGATGSSYTVTASPALDQTRYRVVVSTAGAQTATSAEAVLTVLPDATPPTIASAITSPKLDAVVLTFSEPVQGAATATYTLTGGASVTSVEAPSPRAVVLHTAAALTANTSYTVTATGIKDLASNGGNPFTPNTATFTSGVIFTPVGTRVDDQALFRRYDTLDLTTLPDALTNGTPPDVYVLVSLFEIPVNAANTYASIKTGWFLPPVTGTYVFYDCSDDQSNLYLSTDENPANKKLIGSETGWSASREWTVSSGGSSLTAKRSDQFAGTEWPAGNTITLVAGEPYYIEQRHAEGGGGDNAAATFKVASAGDPEPVNGSAPRITGTNIYTYVDSTQPGPIILKITPGPIVFNKGDKITLQVDAIGTAPLTYQWYQNKIAIAGATAKTYVINSGDYTNVGDYAVKVDNAGGSTVWSTGSTDPAVPGLPGNTGAQDDNLRLIMTGGFLIEAEDFNFNGGSHETVSDTMPYAGNAYAGLTHRPTLDVDFMKPADKSGGAAFSYTRFQATDAGVIEIKGPGDNVDSALGRLRGEFSVTANYALGWTDIGDWQNYTRVFPTGTYVVIGGFAHDAYLDVDAASGFPEIDQTLSKVARPTVADGSTPGTEGGQQGLTTLGTFTGPATGAWSSNDLIPLRDAAGAIVKVDLAGAVTLRLTAGNHDGDQDFLLFYNTVPTTPRPVLTVRQNADRTFTITWINGGTLFKADKADGPYTTTGNSTGTATIPAPGPSAQFWEVQR